jgi:predicted transcriptional regulator
VLKIDVSEKWLPVYEALASDVRIRLIQLLARKEMNLKELAEAVGLSSAIMTMHVKKLEKAGIITSVMIPGRGGAQKLCKLAIDQMQIEFPSKDDRSARDFHESEVSVGHYTDFHVEPTCGLATLDKVVGTFDEPRSFLDPERVNAKILWLGKGYIEYKIPNYLLKSQQPDELEISMEISSEAPLANDNWPSDISFFVNGVLLGSWTSPGDFGGPGVRGRLTPDWWYPDINQYGLLKVLKVNDKGTFLDGQELSSVTLDQLDPRQKTWTFRIAVLDDATHVGGMTLFGSGFGNYNQDINMKLYYHQNGEPTK